MVRTPSAVTAIVWLIQVLTHWLVTGVPLVLIAPLLCLQFDVAAGTMGVMVLALLLGTPCLSLIGSIGAALTIGVRGGGALLALLVLPLYIPVLIFGAGAVSASAEALSPVAHLSLLGAFLLIALVLGPVASAAAVRIALE